MRLPHVSLIVAFFCIYQHSADMSYFSVQIGIFNGSFNTLFITYFYYVPFYYLDHLIANRMAPSICPESGPLWNEMG